MSRVGVVLIDMIKNPPKEPPSNAAGSALTKAETWQKPCTWVPGKAVSDGRALQEMDERVERAVLFMESNCQRTLRLRHIAASIGVSRSRLSALFLAHLEVSPMRLLKTIRMQQARALLQSSSLNVKEIAAHAGFNDISHFIRDFIRLYGTTPAKVRKSK